MRASFRALIPSLCILVAASPLGPATGARERGQESSDDLPGNGLIVYDAGGDLYTISRDGSRVRKVPLPESIEGPAGPAWSPDGTMIAFAGYSSETRSDVYVYDRETDSTSVVVQTEASDYGPHWSPDGGRLVYVSNQTGKYRLHIVNLGSGARRQLTNSSGVDSAPEWGPRGRYIAFHRCRILPGGVLHCRIALFNLRKRTVRFPTPRPPKGRHFEESNPTWSPRGRWLAFTRLSSRGKALMKIRSDGTGVKRLTPWYYDSPISVGSPSWSPNGRRIVYQHLTWDEESRFDAYLRVMRPDGSGDRRLTQPGGQDELGPDWQPRPR